MKNKNPVFARMDAGEAGFAYTEGKSAYQSAGGQQAHPQAGQPVPGAYPPAGQQAPVAYPSVPAGAPTGSIYEPVTDRMTLDDVIMRTGISLAVLLPGAYFGWVSAPSMPWLLMISMLVGFGLAMANIFKKAVSPPLVLAYAGVQGVFLGAVSWFYSDWAASTGYEGNLVSQAVIGTLVAFVMMLVLYKSRIVKVNGRFQKVMMVAMASYLVIALASFVSSLFGVGGGWGFYGVGGLGLLLCVLGVGLASFSLMIDFESISRGVQAGLPSQEAWRMTFGLLVTLIWLYLEILRLLALIAASRD